MSPRLVEDAEGSRYLLLERSSGSSLVVDPDTGDRRRVPTEELDVLDEGSSLSAVLETVPDEVITILTAVHDRRALAVLLELDLTGPVAVRALTTDLPLCESDLHGLLAELRAAGLIDETEVHGERGYETTELASRALAHLQRDCASSPADSGASGS